MFRIIQFQDTGRYGIQNTMTDAILCKKDGNPYSYRSAKRAVWRMRRITHRLVKSIASVTNS